jgi:prefoldin subunit 5
MPQAKNEGDSVLIRQEPSDLYAIVDTNRHYDIYDEIYKVMAQFTEKYPQYAPYLTPAVKAGEDAIPQVFVAMRRLVTNEDRYTKTIREIIEIIQSHVKQLNDNPVSGNEDCIFLRMKLVAICERVTIARDLLIKSSDEFLKEKKAMVEKYKEMKETIQQLEQKVQELEKTKQEIDEKNKANEEAIEQLEQKVQGLEKTKQETNRKIEEMTEGVTKKRESNNELQQSSNVPSVEETSSHSQLELRTSDTANNQSLTRTASSNSTSSQLCNLHIFSNGGGDNRKKFQKVLTKNKYDIIEELLRRMRLEKCSDELSDREKRLALSLVYDLLARFDEEIEKILISNEQYNEFCTSSEKSELIVYIEEKIKEFTQPNKKQEEFTQLEERLNALKKKSSKKNQPENVRVLEGFIFLITKDKSEKFVPYSKEFMKRITKIITPPAQLYSALSNKS